MTIAAGGATIWLLPLLATAQPVAPTFARDIAPIVREYCTSCHRPDGIGPFSLLTFDDVRSRAQLIAQVTGKRGMPPWKPTGGGPLPVNGR